LPNKIKPIPPTYSVKNYLNETLELYKFRKLGKKTYDGSSIGSKKLAEINLRIRNNREAKVRAMDNLFESMANLIYFFEFLNNHPELIHKFRDNVEDMMGETTKSQLHLDSKKAPFARLIRELIGLEYTDAGFSYRTRLLHMLQLLVNKKADEIMMKIDKLPTINAYEMRGMMSSDMKRAKVWMGYIDKFPDSKEKPSRILDIKS
jgi:hypothetical protein